MRDSEDSSESALLLIENFNSLTAPTGLRIGWEFLYKTIVEILFSNYSFHQSFSPGAGS
jgi:hypothetical protein